MVSRAGGVPPVPLKAEMITFRASIRVLSGPLPQIKTDLKRFIKGVCMGLIWCNGVGLQAIKKAPKGLRGWGNVTC